MSSDHVRPAAVAGTFYPGERSTLTETLEALLLTAGAAAAGPDLKGLIVPHAGYQFSGPVAAAGYALLAARDPEPSRVIALGPAHFHTLDGLAVPLAAAFQTPLGRVPVDGAARTRALTCDGVVADDAPHAEEHSLEVHLPFLQSTVPGAGVLPVVVGVAPAHQVAGLLDALWGGPETVVVVSSDLSHYLDYEAATRKDRVTAEAIAGGDIEALSPDSACGYYPVRGFLAAARDHGLTGRILDLRNSGDTAGSRSRVVGYGAFAFSGRSS